ncbi:uncharacterized protein VDAG_02054 [Verticillium dahliae VdLs.17]|uniref:Apolipoprotein/apolipophorin n=1 Tax=Verticillium dahliae (strain VdLs.17 / ATCC MYA-4575 / FGSC 10137) TaxID=498257 RepID=G2WUR3_VERDV|nr:uncharacterized protein VDAG_02054 [Verticillium dahliae VdLs.17]EGY20038.1 hypothetical protein VDAG_02054 [Verticillium dahliae VdLs.17]
MMSARPAVRTIVPRATRSVRMPIRQQTRLQSTTGSSTSSSGGAGASHFGAGVAGGIAGVALFSAIYSFTPAGRTASKVNSTLKDAEKKYTEATKKLQANTPSADEAVNYIKEFAYSYVEVRKNHKDEADALVNDAYKQFQDLSKSGLSLETASKAYDVVADLTKKVAELSGDAISDIIDNHPKLKEKLGGNVDKLKEMGDAYGPEAKKQVDQTWKEVKDIVSGGVSFTTLEKVRKLIEEKVQQVKKLGDEAWKKALEEAKPILDKNPKVKELIEENADALKQGNAKELFDNARKAVDSGDLGDLEGYVKDAVEKGKSKAEEATGGSWGNLEKYIKMVPQGGDILPKLQQLGEVAQKHKAEGEKLFQETIEELKQVLEKKSQKAKEIAEKAEKEAK